MYGTPPQPYQGSGDQQTGYGESYGTYPGQSYAKQPRIEDPFSGSYQGNAEGVFLDMEVDLDQIREFSPVLNIVSGTLHDKSRRHKLWSGDSAAAYFRSQDDVTVTKSGGKHEFRANVAVTLSSGRATGGLVTGTFQKSQSHWSGKVSIHIESGALSFDISRTSLFFRDVNVDIDYTDKVVLPTVELDSLPQKPNAMSNRKMDIFAAFEDAGIKIKYNPKEGDKVEDPSPRNGWLRSDLYEVMAEHFDQIDDADSNIWCMMGTTPPDKYSMGFAFDHKKMHGFALFLGHSTFNGYDSEDPKIKNLANRRLLHYFVHECGHCLGLAHPFEKDDPDSTSWMNYAWKYDERNGPKAFYGDFAYAFSLSELGIMRHAPGANFRKIADNHVSRSAVQSGYGSYYPATDELADDSDDDDEEKSADGSYSGAKKPTRKLNLKLKFTNQTYKKGQMVDYEVRVKNVGKLPAMIEGDLSIEGGNVQMYATDPNGMIKMLEPYVQPIKSSYTKPRVLYTSEDNEGPDRYSELRTIGETKDGYAFSKPGTYTIMAKYSSGRYNVTSESYTVTIEEPDVEEEEEYENLAHVTEVASLGGSSSDRFKKAQQYFENLSKQPVEKKKSHVASMVALFDGMSKASERTVSYGSGRKSKKGRKLVKKEPARSPKKLLEDSDDLITYYHEKGEAADNMGYSNLVMTRAKLYLRENRKENAENEVNRMYGDLLQRNVKPDIILKLAKKWKKMALEEKPEEKEARKKTPAYYQGKLDKVLDWLPSKVEEGEKDITGIGIGTTFDDFDPDKRKRASVVTDMLYNKYEETQDVGAVLKYADALQKGREVNEMVVKYAAESFVARSYAAKNAGLRYPVPKLKDTTLASSAAMTQLIRSGEVTEDWMNYWRCDADFNLHHRHWHQVYRGRGSYEEKHLLRQGELFIFMHAQMIARYDADRETWGLPPVKPFQFEEKNAGFNAGVEFHSRYRSVSARKYGELPRSVAAEFKASEKRYMYAIEHPEYPYFDSPNTRSAIVFNANTTGELLEQTRDHGLGLVSLHNMGHVCLSQIVKRGGSSYMGSSLYAVRDPVFFRWHKYVDTLGQKNHDRFRTDLKDCAASVVLNSSDVMITTSPTPDFAKLDAEVIGTRLDKPTLQFEHDDKLNHEKFYYHLRFRDHKPGRVTIRIFICPEACANERGRWIEMDKFVHQLQKGETVVTREDSESAVIRRQDGWIKKSSEGKFTKIVEGFCDCGWPYNMLLPRGTEDGQRYLLCVTVTDNTKDSISCATKCGSMSYCGAQNMKYPDLLQMGYPFSTPLVGTEYSTLIEVLKSHPNVAVKQFVIKNKENWRENAIKPVLPPRDVPILWPRESQSLHTDGDFRPSRINGWFRLVLYPDNIATKHGKSKIKIRFAGRGTGAGLYRVAKAVIEPLHANSLRRTDAGRAKSIYFNGSSGFDVPENGLVTDAVDFQFTSGITYCISFKLETPGCYLRVRGKRGNTLYSIDSKDADVAWNTTWLKFYYAIYCVQKIIL